MNEVCENCAVRNTERCPYSVREVPENLEFGCYRHVKRVEPYNAKQCRPTRCANCRFLFRKSRAELADKSFIMCGCVPSMTQKILPVPNCPNFKPLRRKQAVKRMGKGSKINLKNKRESK